MEGATARSPTEHRSARRHRPTLGLLALAGVAVVTAYAALPGTPRLRLWLSGLSILGVGLLSSAALSRAARREGAWRGTRPLALFVLSATAANTAFFLANLLDPQNAPHTSSFADEAITLALSGLLLVPLRMEFQEHFEEEDRREIAADVLLIGAAVGAFAFLLLYPGPGAGLSGILSSAVFATAGTGMVAAWGTLALWIPAPVHVIQLGVIGTLGSVGMAFAYRSVRGTYTPGQGWIDVPLALAALALAAAYTLEAWLTPRMRRLAPTTWGRPLLTAAAVAAAAAFLGTAPSSDIESGVGLAGAVVLVAVLAAAIAIRILVNQLWGARAREQTHQALGEKERALAETDAALRELQRVNETLAASEERLRLLFDAAVDGIVELDRAGRVRRVNEAFCRMVGLPRELVLDRTWREVTADVQEADPSLATLPETGQATLTREGHAIHFEARSSVVPGSEGGTLLLVRDVTPAKVAEQTIRSLFKFLQDRDEDRSSLLKRTNAAIEAERNRIARDLHDGPVQGISATTLTLEAVLMLLEQGDQEEAVSLLTEVRRQLSEETDGLRRLLADLRPPVLEERGLVPGLREAVARFGRAHGIRATFRSRAMREVPSDIEILAYRIVQEALSNAAKHARATEVAVSVETAGGELRIEVSDNGVGFDPSRARDFLRTGRVGLASMRERTELAQGTLTVRSRPGGGTTVAATFPLESIPTDGQLARM